MPATSLNAVTGNSTFQRRRTVNRNKLTIADLYLDAKGRTLMFTGFRTRPPSGGGGVQVYKDGTVVIDTSLPSLGTTEGGQTIIGYQSMVVEGRIRTGSDGTTVSFTRGNVTWIGRAEITLNKV